MRDANRTDAIWVTVQRTGDVWLGNEKLTADQLPAGIQERLRKGSEKKVYINADSRAKYGRVREALAAIQSSGGEGCISGLGRKTVSRALTPDRKDRG
jgi:biopolymer transport protein ExbD